MPVPRVRTHYDDGMIEGEIVKGPTSTGLFVIRIHDDLTLARHVDRIVPLDDAAKALVAKAGA